MARVFILFLMMLGSIPSINLVFAADSDRQETENKNDKPNGSGTYPATVSPFILKDPSGNTHNSEDLYKKNGMLLIFTVPNLPQYERQKRWEKWIKRESWPEQNAPRCVVVEDMSQQESCKDRARKAIDEKSKEDSRMQFLIDETGDVRREFGIQQNETVILIVDSNGTVIHHEGDDVEPEHNSAHRLVQQVLRLSRQARLLSAATLQSPAASVKTDVATTQR